MTTLSLLQRLRSLGVKLWLDGDTVRFTAPKGALTPELRDQLKEQKDAIKDLLAQASGSAAPPPIEPISRGVELPLSFGQQRLWFLDQLDPGQSSYNVPMPLRFEGALDRAALERALREIVRRHESLRATFSSAGGRPAQVILPSVAIDLPVEDLGALPPEERRAELRRRLAEDARRPFDLAVGPLIRARLMRLGDEEHALSLVFHHIVADAWSNGVFLRELGALYKAYHAGLSSPLPELQIQYVDYAAWQQRWLSGDVLERHLAFWKKQLAGAAALELPTDRPRPPLPSNRGARRPISVPPDVTGKLQKLAQREGASLFMTLLAAFDVLLHRWSGQDDLVVGTPIANRTRAETEGLIGFFVNTLAIRTRLSGEMSFRELVALVKETCLGAYAHQEMPFERIVQEVEPERDASRTPIFQVVFSLQNVPGEGMTSEGLRIRGIGGEGTTAKFDLVLAMFEGPNGLAGTIEWATDLFDAATIDRMARHLGTLLAGIAERPDARLWELPILDAEERQTVLVTWNDTRRPYPRDASIQALFEAQARRTPDAIAIVSGDREITYRELAEQAFKLARYLRRHGVSAETPVGLLARRSPEMVIATLGILAAGGAYVPLDPSFPVARLAFMVEDAGLGLVLAVGEPVAGGAIGAARVVSFHDARSEAEAESAEPLDTETHGGSLAYIMYTSGSTGLPKGVCVEHRGVTRLVVGAEFAWFGPDEVFVQLASIAFDAATLELWGPLLNGGTLVVPDAEQPSLAEIGEIIRRHGVTTMWLTTGLFNAMIERSPSELSPLRQLLTGGDAISIPHAQKALAELHGVRLINGYGPTEGTTFTTTFTVESADGPVPIGKPITNTTALVLDAHMQPVPIGVAGELYAGGDGIARGYLNRPELTRERFVPDPFSADAGARLYRTGDVVRWTPSGDILFLGRRDLQVKIRGFRIELGEIDAALAQHSAVREVVTLAREDVPGDKRLVAYVVWAEGAPAAPELRAYLKERLPDYMVPSAFVTLAAMPLNANGKIDRRALPAPDLAASASDGDVEPPRGPVEEAIAAIFSEVLGVPAVGARDGFFDLGGHSLLATQAIARIRDTFGVDLPLRQLFDAPAVADLAARVEAALKADRGVAAPALTREMSSPGNAPISFAQERLWFLNRLEPDEPTYVVPVAMRLEGSLDQDALARALTEIVRRHEALRTTFAMVDDRPAGVIHEAMPIDLAVTHLDALAAPDREPALRKEIALEARRPFDLGAGPVIRARLFELSEGEHVLLLTMHHIVADGWSLGALNREITVLYEAFRAGRPSPLPELPVQYADYARWQRQYLSGETLDRQLAYWRERLDGAPRLLDLPTDRPRPPVQSSRGGFRSFTISEATAKALRELSRREGATLFMTLLAAFDVLLHRYTRQTDVVVGSPIANRTRAETEGLIGFFVNTLVLRTEVSDDLPFRELIARVREVCLGAYAHQDMPFERLVQELAPERDRSRSPIFQVLFTLQNAVSSAVAISGVKRRNVRVETATSKFDITLALLDGPAGIVGALEYRTDLFDAGTIDRMAGHYAVILRAIAKDAGTEVGRLPLLTEAERARLLVEWNDTAAPYPRHLTAHQLFEAQVDRTPDATAVIFEGESLTYRALDRAANKVASYLRKLGVGPDVLVGLCVSRSIATVVGILGILKAGGAYVPLDPSYPVDRLAWMLEDSAVPVVLTLDRLADELPVQGAMVIRLDADQEMIEAEGDERLEAAAGPDDLAYIIYTSGSTGKPKGVMIHHRGLVNYLCHCLSAYPVGDGSGAPVHSSVGFDLTITGLFAPLVAGKAVTMIAEGREIDALAGALADPGGFSLVKLTPAHLEVMSQLLPAAKAAGSTRALVIGGEALSWETLAFWRKNAPETRLINEYGPTETVVGCSTYDAARPGDFRGTVPIGKPISNTSLYVLDGRRQPLPIGVPGELYIGGDGVARGYLNRPELTEERFVPDPFSAAPGARMYRTGDLARWLPTGDLDFLGRVDHQVKIRGYRIELGEIEAVLGQHSNLREVAVIAREDSPGDKRLVAYFVAEEEPAPTAAELASSLGQTLPEYMIPSAFVALAAMPLTSNGKVDRKALPAPEARVGIEGDVVAPRNPIEEVLVGIWSEVLGTAQLGVHDDFFQLGGHSLLATQVMGRLATAFRVELPLQALFESPTVAGLAERVAAGMQEGNAIEAPPLVRIPREETIELSFGQERLWFLDQLEPGDPSYIVPAPMRLEGALDEDALRRAIHEIMRRHEVLRTTFATLDGRPVQVIHEGLEIPVPVLDLRALPEAEREARARAEAAEDARTPFDLSRGPLVRARLLALGDDDHLLLLTMHHIVSDAWSQGILRREVVTLYGAFREGRGSPLLDLPIQYADYAHWQRAWLDGEALARQLAYWRQRLDGAPRALELATDRPRPPVQSHRGAQRSFVVPRDVADAVRDLSRREGVTPFMTLLAAFDVLLHRYTGQDDIVVGSPIANRTHAETEQLIGFFLNTLVLRTKLSAELSFRDLVHRVKDACLGAYAHREVPFEKLVQEIAPERDMSRSPLFQVSFTVTTSGGSVAMPGVRVRGASIDVTTAKFDLTLGFNEGPRGLVGGIEYATDLFDDATIERMIAHLGALLEGIARDPDQRVGELPLLGAGERELCISGWNATDVAYPEGLRLHELFEAQVDRTPDAVAVVAGGVALSYRELDERANRLANHLLGLGVGRDVLVGVCMERSIELVAALLGVLKAGGAYVPLDPSYPKERLDFMLADAGVAVLLTQARLKGLWPESGAGVIALDAEPAIGGASADRPPCEATASSVAYMIYTSGSTGQPKGAMIPHRAIVNHMLWMRGALPIGPADAVLQKTPASFDASVWEFHAPLMSGAKLVMAEPDGHRDPAYMVRAIADHAVTVLQLVPSMAELVLLEPGLDACKSLKRLCLGGEALSRSLVDRFRARLPGLEVVNLYGPTECTIDATYWISEPEGAGAVMEPIGRPIANMRAYVLDRRLEPVPVGVPGELCLGGAGVGLGYLGRPELTRERFVPDSFTGKGSIYRTGDLVRRRASGVIEYLGRIDHQVKVRGFRIELGEIEAAIARHPSVREVVVVARESAPGAGDKRLVAYLVAKDAPAVGELRAFLKERVPEYMVPSAFVTLERMPLMANGKVDRNALPAPDAGSAADASAFVAPRSTVEQRLADIWAALLRLPRVGVHENFFEVGGDSILSIQIVARARQAGLTLTPRQVFQHQTIAELAEVVGTTAAIVAEQGAVTGPVPLTPVQHAFFDREPEDPHHYNQAFFFEVPGPLDAEILEEVVVRLFDHHDALRLRARRDEAGWQLTGAAPGGVSPFRRVDLREVPDADRRAVIERATADAQASLNLAEGPLGRVVLFDLGPDEPSRLLLAIHHLGVDGVSWRILLEDLWSSYEAHKKGQPISLGAKTTSFKRWAERLVEHARGEVIAAEEAYWRGDRRARVERIPIDHDRGENTEEAARQVTGALTADETTALLRDVPEVYRTQINDVLLTALAQAFEGFTGSPVTLVDLEGHGREDIFDDVDLTRTVGWFTAIFPVALETDRLDGPGTAIMSVKEQLRAVPNRGIGYGILRYLRGDDDPTAKALRAMPEAEVSFNYLGQFDHATPEATAIRGARESSGPSASPRARRPYLIDVAASVSSGRLSVRWTYSENRHRRESIEDLSSRFLSALRALVDHCLSPDAGGVTPSDFQKANLTQDLIDMVAAFDPSADEDDEGAGAS